VAAPAQQYFQGLLSCSQALQCGSCPGPES
jgi:hypothetical protein